MAKCARKTWYFHVTAASNLPSIQRDGLIPSIGPRSKECGETQPAIYLFGRLEDVENALMNWMGEIFPDTDRVAVLAVPSDQISPTPSASYEVVVPHAIPASMIRVLMTDADDPEAFRQAAREISETPAAKPAPRPPRRVSMYSF